MSGVCPSCGAAILTYAEVEERTSRTSGQFKNFSGHMFSLLDVFSVDDARTKLRTCWGGITFDAWIQGRPDAEQWLREWDAREDVLAKTCVMAATSEQLQTVCPGECRPSDGLVAIDANHRLASLAYRRARGNKDPFTIPVYVPHVCGGGGLVAS